MFGSVSTQTQSQNQSKRMMEHKYSESSSVNLNLYHKPQEPSEFSGGNHYSPSSPAHNENLQGEDALKQAPVPGKGTSEFQTQQVNLDCQNKLNCTQAVRNNYQKTKGWLYRLSRKHKNKWSSLFFVLSQNPW